MKALKGEGSLLKDGRIKIAFIFDQNIGSEAIKLPEEVEITGRQESSELAINADLNKAHTLAVNFINLMEAYQHDLYQNAPEDM